MAEAPRDQNRVPAVLFESDSNAGVTLTGKINETAGRILVNGAGGGDITGPGSSTDNAIARWDGTSGTKIQNSTAFILDNGRVGFGTATPGAPLEIHTLAGINAELWLVQETDTTIKFKAQDAQTRITSTNPILFDSDDSGTNIMTLNSSGFGGVFQPVTRADAAAPNNSVYFSSDSTKLVYKDSGGVVHALY